VGEPIEDSAASMRSFGEPDHQHKNDHDPKPKERPPVATR